LVGAILADGWVVERIEDSRVLLSRNGRIAALQY
jgi:type III secretion protein D